MPLILGLDFGLKRCGLAVTDELKIIASALTTVPSTELMVYLREFISKNEVELLVVGEATRMSGEDSPIEGNIKLFIEDFIKEFPGIPVARQDESYTSRQAVQDMIKAGHGKKVRRVKSNIDKVSAVLILQRFLETQR